MEQKELLYVSSLVSQCWTQSVISYTFIMGVDVMGFFRGVGAFNYFFELFFEGGMIVQHTSLIALKNRFEFI